MGKQRNQVAYWSFLALIAIVFPLTFLEIVLRLLPVHEGTYRLPVNNENPILRFEPNRRFVSSSGWNFELINNVKTNNFGFINNVDYSNDNAAPTLAIIGDSYVEAIMVPFRETVTGRLGEYWGDRRHVYSFGVSGAPLSQYLAYAAYVRKTFHPDAIVIVVVGNDFDESLRKYKSTPGYHYFVKSGDSRMTLERVDYSPSLVTRILRRSALGRYAGINLQLSSRVKHLEQVLSTKNGGTAEFVGNTSSNAESSRVNDSKWAIDAFLQSLPVWAGLSESRILFVIDGMRPHLYNETQLMSARGSYFDLMRTYFVDATTKRGYEVVDMQSIFLAHYQQHGRRFEHQHDMHWNALGHELCFEAIRKSAVFSKLSVQSTSVSDKQDML